MSESKIVRRGENEARGSVPGQRKTQNGGYVRPWVGGERVVNDRTPEDLEEGTRVFSHDRLSKKIKAIDPVASERYDDALAAATLKIYRLVSNQETDGKYSVVYVVFTAGSDFPNHSHDIAHASVMIVEGHGTVVLDGEKIPFKAGDVIHIPPKTVHEFFVALDCPRVGYLAITAPELAYEEDDLAKVDWISHPGLFYGMDGKLNRDAIDDD